MTRRLLSPLHTLPLWLLLASPLIAEETTPATPKATAVSPTELRPAIEKGLAFLEKEGLAWMNNRKCIACHHGAFLLWSHNETRLRGFAVPSEKLGAWTTQALNLYLGGEKDALKKKNGAVETTNMLLGQVTPTGDDKLAQELKRLSALLVNAQKPEGFWKYEGQGQNRPAEEADEATTLWAVLALTFVEKTDPAYPRARAQALAWLKAHQTGTGNEPAALRLLIEARFGEPNRARERALELVARQNSDGSWSWGKTYAGDAYATGQSLYALGEVGLAGDHPAVQKAWKFLLQKQNPDGSFFAPSKKPNVKENPIATYWGSAWAVIGLLHTLPLQVADPARKPEQPKKVDPVFAPVTDDPKLPRVLVYRDSISIGYTLPVRKLLAGKANVHRIAENGGPTSNGLKKINKWLGGKWDVIHFNWGLHDLKMDAEGKHQVPLPEYEKNLRELVKRLKATNAKLIWASTTPVPEGKVNPPRKDSDVMAYNAAARKIMEENGIASDDLYSFAQPMLAKIQLPANVHFTDKGSEALAERVAASIQAALGKK